MRITHHGIRDFRKAVGRVVRFVLFAVVPVAVSAATTLDHLGRCQDEEILTGERIAACTIVLEDSSQQPDIRAEALLNRAIAQLAAGHRDKSFADLDMAIALNPEYSAPYFVRGGAHLDAGDAAKAVADLSVALRLNPANSDILETRGRAHLLGGANDLSLKDLDAAIALDAENADSYALRGLASERLKNAKAALADYQRALTIDPTHELAIEGTKRLRSKT